MKLKTSAHTPADGYVLPGCIALVAFLHTRGTDTASALLLLRLVQEDDHELYEEDVKRILDVDMIGAWTAMADLQSKGWCEHHATRDEQERIALTDAGQLEALAMFGAVMLAGTPAGDAATPVS